MTLLTLLDADSQVIVLEPFFEGSISAIRLAGGKERLVPLVFEDDSWQIDWRALNRAFNRKTRAIIINTPHNPTGAMLRSSDFDRLLDICGKWGATLICDEIYSQLVYPPDQFVSALSKRFCEGSCIVVDGLSKAYNVTGWRVGYVTAPLEVTRAIRKVQSALGATAPTPFQVAARDALLDTQLDEQLRASKALFKQNRDDLCACLRAKGFRLAVPDGGTFLFADGAHLSVDDQACRDLLVDKSKVLAMPGSWFFRKPPAGAWLRFTFARSRASIEAAIAQLQNL